MSSSMYEQGIVKTQISQHIHATLLRIHRKGKAKSVPADDGVSGFPSVKF